MWCLDKLVLVHANQTKGNTLAKHFGSIDPGPPGEQVDARVLLLVQSAPGTRDWECDDLQARVPEVRHYLSGWVGAHPAQ